MRQTHADLRFNAGRLAGDADIDRRERGVLAETPDFYHRFISFTDA